MILVSCNHNEQQNHDVKWQWHRDEMNEKVVEEEARKIRAIEANVTEGDGLHDVDENLPDIVLFFIIIYRYVRTNYRRLKKHLKKAFEKQADEEVMAILMRYYSTTST